MIERQIKMGYVTQFKLKVLPMDNSLLKEGILDITIKDLIFGIECKWYDYNDDMLLLSKQHPNNLFILDGYGEDNWDIWRAFYKNGKTYKWRLKEVIILPEFDESLMK